MKNEERSLELFLNIIAISSFFNVASFWWDGWWHVEIGRDSAFIPPHLLSYFSVFIFIFCLTLLYIKTKRKLYLNLIFIQFLIILTGPLDSLWHIFFGYEDLTTPLAIWSPPHAIAAGLTIISLAIILDDWIKNYKKGKKEYFMRIFLISSSILSFFNFLLVPLQPFGWHFVFKQWGVIITIFVSLLYIFVLSYNMPKSGIASFVTMSLLIFIGFRGVIPAFNIILPQHADPPLWLNFFAIMPSAIFVDFINIRKTNPILIGAICGFLVYFVYFLGWNFIQKPDFFLNQIQSITLIFVAVIGGVLAGAMLLLINKRVKK